MEWDYPVSFLRRVWYVDGQEIQAPQWEIVLQANYRSNDMNSDEQQVAVATEDNQEEVKMPRVCTEIIAIAKQVRKDVSPDDFATVFNAIITAIYG